MSVFLRAVLNDSNIDALQASSQRYIVITGSAPSRQASSIPINLCLALDKSGSMTGEPLYRVQQASKHIVDELSPADHLSIIAFDHECETILPCELVRDKDKIKAKIDRISEGGGTCIDGGMRASLSELQKLVGRGSFIHRTFVLTDGFNEHGSDPQCLSIAEQAVRQDISFSAFGIGDQWNLELLERIADAGNGRMYHIERPDETSRIFDNEVRRLQSVGAINVRLQLFLKNGVRLAELEPVYQVMPDVILQKHDILQQSRNWPYPSGSNVQGYEVKLGSLATDQETVLTAMVYLPKLSQGAVEVAGMRLVYDQPPQTELATPMVELSAFSVDLYVPQFLPGVKPLLDKLAVYKQQKIADKLATEGKHKQAATLLQTASKTLFQNGDQKGATVLQKAAQTLLQGQELDPNLKIKTKLVTKTVLR